MNLALLYLDLVTPAVCEMLPRSLDDARRMWY